MPILSLGKSNQVVGLDIGTRSVRAVELTINKQPPVLGKVGFSRIPEGLVVDGEIADVKQVSRYLRDLWKKSGLAKRDIVIGIANQKVIVRVVELPAMTQAELKGAIRFQAADYIPMPIEDTILDFEILEEHEGRDGEKLSKVLLVAAQREMIQTFVDALAGAGLSPKSIDVKSFALMRSLLPKLSLIPSEEDTKTAKSTVCLLNVGAGVTNMLIVHEGMPHFVRIILFGGKDFTEALVEQMKLTYDKAEDLKVSLSTSGKRTRKTAKQKVKEEKAQEVLKPKISQFVREIRRSIDYCIDQTGSSAPEKIILSGRGAQVYGLASDLKKVLQIEVVHGKSLQNIKVGRLNLGEEQVMEIEPSLAVPIGLGLMGTEK